ncbi:hypothetical protein Tco_0546723 [Tanacetum coccineum]
MALVMDVLSGGKDHLLCNGEWIDITMRKVNILLSMDEDADFDNQSIERDRLIGIEFVLDFVEFISFTFSDKEMILVIEAVLR